MIRDGRNWVKSMSKDEILKKTFSCANLILTNKQVPLFNQIEELLLSDYLVRAKFTHLGYNGTHLYCNGRYLAYRSKKHLPIKFTESVKLIEGVPLESSGSNNYPTVRFKDNHCILEFISNGLPIIDDLNGWEIQVLSIEKI